MSQAHLDELTLALSRHGWLIMKSDPDDGDQGEFTWIINRGDDGPSFQIDFCRFDSMGEDIPIEKSYGCDIRGKSGPGLYFRRINRSRELWRKELEEFVASLDQKTTS